MPEDPTKDLTAVEMLRMLLADVRDVKGRLSAVETELATLNTTVEDRFKDTRPIWQAINQRTERIEARAEETNARLDTLTERVTAVEKELQSVNR